MPPETLFDGYSCNVCGQFHPGQYVSMSCDSPDPYARLTDAEKNRAHLGTDDCVIDDEYYLRGVVELPITGVEEKFLWGVWARVWQRDYKEFTDHYDVSRREETIGPYKGRLCNNLPGYLPTTLNLRCSIQVQPVGTRPLFVLDEPEHPLAIEQREGITLKRAREIAALVHHKK